MWRAGKGSLKPLYKDSNLIREAFIPMTNGLPKHPPHDIITLRGRIPTCESGSRGHTYLQQTTAIHLPAHLPSVSVFLLTMWVLVIEMGHQAW